jgi:hypothetical protein
LSPQTWAFNLRSSSDAPNLQVENEETIEALSARTKALLERSNSAFILAAAESAAAIASPIAPNCLSLAFASGTHRLSPSFSSCSSLPSRRCRGSRRAAPARFCRVTSASRYDWHFSVGVGIGPNTGHAGYNNNALNEASGDPQ